MSEISTDGLVAEGLQKAYQDDLILRDVSLSIRPGSITALVGPNGSGKSTLLRALSLLEPPDAGTIQLDNRRFVFPDTDPEEFADIWPRLTVVFQQLFLWPHLTARQNLSLALRGKAKSAERVDEVIELFDLRPFLDRYPNQISLGQRQRVAIARALALRPKYLLLDEITSALDVQQTNTLLEELERLRSQGVGILLVTHLIGFARSAADQVAFLAKGRIGELGGPEILRAPTNPLLAKLLSLLD